MARTRDSYDSMMRSSFEIGRKDCREDLVLKLLKQQSHRRLILCFGPSDGSTLPPPQLSPAAQVIIAPEIGALPLQLSQSAGLEC